MAQCVCGRPHHQKAEEEVGVSKGEAGGDPSASSIAVYCLWLVLVLVKKGI